MEPADKDSKLKLSRNEMQKLEHCSVKGKV